MFPALFIFLNFAHNGQQYNKIKNFLESFTLNVNNVEYMNVKVFK